MKLVFTWIQGCGKWTQARLLTEKHWFTLLEMWQELRKIADSWSELWNKVKRVIESWALVTPDIVWEIMQETLDKQTNERLILDWFVRNEWNKESLDNITTDYKVVLFELSKEKAIERLLWRMYDSQTWETFPNWTLINPNNWNELIKRVDDNEESILKRIDEFMNNTLPTALKQELDNPEKVIRVNADQSVENVEKELQNKLWL